MTQIHIPFSSTSLSDFMLNQGAPTYLSAVSLTGNHLANNATTFDVTREEEQCALADKLASDLTLSAAVEVKDGDKDTVASFEEGLTNLATAIKDVAKSSTEKFELQGFAQGFRQKLMNSVEKIKARLDSLVTSFNSGLFQKSVNQGKL